MAAMEQDVARAGAVVEEQVEEAHVRDEAELGIAMRVDRVIEVLPDQANAGAAHQLVVDLLAAGEIAMSSDLVAQVDDARGTVALEAEGRCAHGRNVDAQPAARELEQVEIEIQHALPAGREH